MTKESSAQQRQTWTSALSSSIQSLQMISKYLADLQRILERQSPLIMLRFPNFLLVLWPQVSKKCQEELKSRKKVAFHA